MRLIKLVLIGPPGSGKGTQAVRISERYTVPTISTGDILRAAVKARTPLGLAVQATMEAGGLVSDAMMIDLVRDRLAPTDAAHGFILDGFPRTAAQADALEAMSTGQRPLALVLNVPEAELLRRLVSRRVCTGCKRLTTGGTSFGSEAELCSHCHAPLMMRADDNEHTIKNRLSTYRQMADPLIQHYRSRGVLVSINGYQDTDEVTAEVFKVLDAVADGV